MGSSNIVSDNSNGNGTGTGNGNGNTSISTEIEAEDHITPAAPFIQGETVLASHTNCLYEAKVRQVDYNHNNQWRFFIHYLGWKKSWDEWVGVDRLLKHTAENMTKKLALDEKHGNDKNAKTPRASQAKSKGSNVAKGKKGKNESLVKVKTEVHPDKLVNIQIPPALKKRLVDDCEFITNLGKLVKLPRTPSVSDIFKNYFDCKVKKSGSISDSAEEIMKGLCSYFDKALPMTLLYPNEREQYREACPDNILPSAIYGAEHLLRLFVKLPELLLNLSIEGETFKELQAQLRDFLRFLQRNQSTFFLSTYHVREDIENSTNKQGD